MSLYRKVINMCLRTFLLDHDPNQRSGQTLLTGGRGHRVFSPFLYWYKIVLFNADLILGVATLSKTTDFEECQGRGHKLKISGVSYFFCMSASVIWLFGMFGYTVFDIRRLFLLQSKLIFKLWTFSLFKFQLKYRFLF